MVVVMTVELAELEPLTPRLTSLMLPAAVSNAPG